MTLSLEQKRGFAHDGFLYLPGVVPPHRVETARMHINHWLGHHFDPAKEETYGQQSYAPELRSTPMIKSLVDDSPIYEMAEQLTAPGALHPVSKGQIALRFPSPGQERRPPGGHIDGIPNGKNGVPPGTIVSFTLLVGVALSDLPGEYSGNLSLWPGSHLKLGEWFQTHELQELLQSRVPKLDYGEPLQVRWQVGDAMLVHHLTLHGIAPNLSPNIRYACYYRLHHRQHEAWKREVVREIFKEFDGVRAVLDDHES